MDYETIGDDLKRIREERGLSTDAVAALLGLTRGAVGHYERARRKIPLPTLEKWAAVCNHRLVLDIVPVGVDDLGPLSIAERDLVTLVRALSQEDQHMVLDLAAALPGHPVARDGVASQIQTLVKFARSDVGRGSEIDRTTG